MLQVVRDMLPMEERTVGTYTSEQRDIGFSNEAGLFFLFADNPTPGTEFVVKIYDTMDQYAEYWWLSVQKTITLADMTNVNNKYTYHYPIEFPLGWKAYIEVTLSGGTSTFRVGLVGRRIAKGL